MCISIRNCASFLIFFLFFSCAKAPQNTGIQISVPDLGITITLPQNFTQFSSTQLTALQHEIEVSDPIKPFSEYPVIVFQNPSNGNSVAIYKLSLTQTNSDWTNLDGALYEYHKNLEDHFATKIPFDDVIAKDYHFLLLRITFVTEQAEVNLDKGLYFCLPDQFFMMDLFSQKSILTEEELIAFENMFQSLKITN
jgi:hypothetical protein